MADVGPRDEFVNSSDGFIGVITIDPNGKEKAIAVRSGASVWLSESEQILTANAPRNDEDNPFTNGDLKLRTRAADIKNRRPIGTAQAEADPKTDEEQEGEEESAAETPSPNGSSPKVVDLASTEEQETEKPVKPRAKADQARQKNEEKRQAEAKKQAEAGAVPVKEVGASVSPKGVPEVGSRAAGEEVGNPEAPAQGKSEE